MRPERSSSARSRRARAAFSSGPPAAARTTSRLVGAAGSRAANAMGCGPESTMPTTVKRVGRPRTMSVASAPTVSSPSALATRRLTTSASRSPSTSHRPLSTGSARIAVAGGTQLTGKALPSIPSLPRTATGPAAQASAAATPGTAAAAASRIAGGCGSSNVTTASKAIKVPKR